MLETRAVGAEIEAQAGCGHLDVELGQAGGGTDALHQQLSLLNAKYDERSVRFAAQLLPIHVYDTATTRPVAVLPRPGKTPSGPDVRCHLRRLICRTRRYLPHTFLTIRGDGHSARPEVIARSETNTVDYILGLPGTAVLSRLLKAATDDVRVPRAEAQAPALRRYAEARYGTKSWQRGRLANGQVRGQPAMLGHPLRGDKRHRRHRRMGL